MCQVLAGVLCIGDIKIEEDLSDYHLGEISTIANPAHVVKGGQMETLALCHSLLILLKSYSW